MRSVSGTFKASERASSTRVYFKVIFNNSKTVTMDAIQSMTITDSISEDASVSIGAALARSCEMTMEVQSGLSLYHAYFVPYAGYSETEMVPLGKFYVDEQSIISDGIVKITAYDKIAVMDKPYEPQAVSLTPENVVKDICTQNGVPFTLGKYDFPGGTVSLIEDITQRQMLGYMAGLLGMNAYINDIGEMAFKGYKLTGGYYGDVDHNGVINASDVSYINANLLGTASDNAYASILGEMIAGKSILGVEACVYPESILADVDQDGVVTSDDVAEIQAYISGHPYPGTLVGTTWTPQEISEDDYIQFTRQEESPFTIGILISGTEENPITAGTSGNAITFGNPYMTQSILNAILADWQGLEIMPSTVQWVPMLSYETGDIVIIHEGDDTYEVPIMTQTLTFDGGLSGEFNSIGPEDDELRVGNVSIIERNIERKVDARVANVEEITSSISKELGGTVEFLKDANGNNYGMAIYNGGKSKGWIWTAGGFGYFTGSAVLPTSVAFDMDGNLNANYITAGTIRGVNLYAQSSNGVRVEIDSDSLDICDWNGITSTKRGRFTATTYGGSHTGTKTKGVALTTENEQGYLALGCKQPGASVAYTYLLLNNGLNPDGYTESLIFYGVSRFRDTINASTINASTINASGDIEADGDITGSHLYGTLGESGEGEKVFLNPVAVSSSNFTDAGYSSSTKGLGYNASSRRYKKYIGEVKDDNLLPEKLYDLPVVQFKYRAHSIEDGVPEEYQIGFIAEDMDEIYPFACYYKDGRPEAWTGKNLIPPMLKLIQDQHKEIEELKTRLEALEND